MTVELKVKNLRRAVCPLKKGLANCVDVRADELNFSVTIDVKKLPELIANLAFQSALQSAQGDSSTQVESAKKVVKSGDES